MAAAMSLESILSISTPATDRTLLSIEELREAADVTDKSQDAELIRMGRRVADRIARACRIRAGGAVIPTLRQETIVETFRQKGRRDFSFGHHWPHRIRLARRPIVSVLALTSDGVVVDMTNLEIDGAAGMAEWITGRGSFTGNRVAIQYVAGWQVVPEDLKQAAVELLQQYLDNSEQPSGLQLINIPNVVERRFWVGQPSDPDLPTSIMDKLWPYRNED
jgi:hypothetical protein